jgi:hypothetical protein
MIKICGIKNYTREIIDGDLILTPKKWMKEEEFKSINLAHSKIIKCKIKCGDQIVSNETHYYSIVHDLWISMPVNRVLHLTTFNMKLTNEGGKNGYRWIDDLGISAQYKCSNGTMTEILNMVNHNNYYINMIIQLANGEKIFFKRYEKVSNANP